MPTLIHRRVALAQAGDNPYVIGKMPSGWLVIGDVQPLPGYCLLLADPPVSSINSLNDEDRARYLLDTVKIGDALLKVTGAYRINYETWGNGEAALHTHITPRFLSEPDEKRKSPAGHGYDWRTTRKFDPVLDGKFMREMREALGIQRAAGAHA